MTQRIEHFFSLLWLKELNTFLFWLWEFEPFFENMTHRNQFFLKWLTKCNLFSFLKWLKELNLESFWRWLKEFLHFFWIWFTEQFLNMISKNWTFLENATRRIYFAFWKLQNFSLKKDSKNRSFIFWQWVEEFDFFLNMTQRIPFVNYDSNGTFFSNMTQRIELFFSLTPRIEVFLQKNTTHRIEPFFPKKKTWPKNWLFFWNMTQRIEPFISWRTELKLFSNMSRIEPFFKIWLKELNTLLNTTQRIEHFVNMTQRIELFLKYDSKCCFCEKIDSRICFFKNWSLFYMWLKELNFLENDSQNWNFFFEYDSHNWTFFFLKKKKKNKDLNSFFFGYDSKIELFFWFDSKKWTLFLIWLKELNFLNDSLKNFNFFFLN